MAVYQLVKKLRATIKATMRSSVLKLHVAEGLARRELEELNALPGQEGGLTGINRAGFQDHREI